MTAEEYERQQIGPNSQNSEWPVHSKQNGHYIAVFMSVPKSLPKFQRQDIRSDRIFRFFEIGSFQQFRSLLNFKLSKQFFLSALFYSLTFVSFSGRKQQRV